MLVKLFGLFNVLYVCKKFWNKPEIKGELFFIALNLNDRLGIWAISQSKAHRNLFNSLFSTHNKFVFSDS